MKLAVSALVLLVLLVLGLAGCDSTGHRTLGSQPPDHTQSDLESTAPVNSTSVIHVFVALCDNVNQGIVPVTATVGNGDDPARNLYWGAAFGVKTFFNKGKDWRLVSVQTEGLPAGILERIVFKRRDRAAFLVAEAYRGSEIKRATEDFLEATAGRPGATLTISDNGKSTALHLSGSAQVLAYVGHNGLMDFRLTSFPRQRDREKRDAIILACASKRYFAEPLRTTGADPLLWTTNLMAPEAYVLSAAIDGWLAKEADEQIRLRAAKAYNQYQNCGLQSASKLFATGW